MNPPNPKQSETDLGKDVLMKVVFCAFIMSGIDGHMDDDETDLIKDFTTNHWKEEFGNIDAFYIQVEKAVMQYFVPDEDKPQLDNDSLNDTLSELTVGEELILIELLKDVMMADEIIEPAEAELLQRVEKHYQAR